MPLRFHGSPRHHAVVPRSHPLRPAHPFSQRSGKSAGDIGALVLTRWQVPTTLIECARQRNKWLHDHDGEADLTDLALLASALQIQPTNLSEPLPAQRRLGFEQPLAGLREELLAEQQLWLRMLA